MGGESVLELSLMSDCFRDAAVIVAFTQGAVGLRAALTGPHWAATALLFVCVPLDSPLVVTEGSTGFRTEGG